MALNIILVITSVLFGILIIVASFYFLVYFQSPDDKWCAWFPKFLVVKKLKYFLIKKVTGISISAYNIFLLPLDVANQNGSFFLQADSIPVGKITVVMYIITVVMVLLLVPFTVFWYEGLDEDDDPEGKSSMGRQLAFALKWLIPMNIIIAVVIGVLYNFYGKANIPLQILSGQLAPRGEFQNINYYCSSSFTPNDTPCKIISDTPLEIQVNILVYIIAIVTFAGSIIFAIFGGVGLVCLPVDLIESFVHRTRPISTKEYEERKKIIGEQASILHEAGSQIIEDVKGNGKGYRSRRQRNLKRKENDFRRDVMILEIHFRRLEDSYKHHGGDLILQVVKLIGGIFSAILSLNWVLHIILYTIPMTLNLPIGYFHLWLNAFLDELNKAVPFVATAFYAIFSLYLLACVIKGVTKLGMRIFFITIHPMSIGDTMMNSLVFNTGVIAITSMSVAQFCTISFSYYARNSASQSIFAVQITNLQGLYYGQWGIVCAIPAIAGLTGLYQLYNPYKKQKENRMNFKW